MKSITLTDADWKRIVAMVRRGYEDDGDGRYFSIEELAKAKPTPFNDGEAKLQMRAARRLERLVAEDDKQPR